MDKTISTQMNPENAFSNALKLSTIVQPDLAMTDMGTLPVCMSLDIIRRLAQMIALKCRNESNNAIMQGEAKLKNIHNPHIPYINVLFSKDIGIPGSVSSFNIAVTVPVANSPINTVKARKIPDSFLDIFCSTKA